MRKRLIFAAGIGVGYVLGARAGRERFDQIVIQARRLWESPTVQEAAGVVHAQATKLYDGGRQAMTNQLHRHHRHNGSGQDPNKQGGGWAAAEDLEDPGARRTASPASAF